VLAGADLPPEKLVPLFRHCKINRIDRVFEFQLDSGSDRDNMARAVGQEAARSGVKNRGLCLRRLTACLAQASGGGEIRIRVCSAIVQPETAEVLDAIRQHRR